MSASELCALYLKKGFFLTVVVPALLAGSLKSGISASKRAMVRFRSGLRAPALAWMGNRMLLSKFLEQPKHLPTLLSVDS